MNVVLNQHSHFTDEETGSGRSGDLSKVIQQQLSALFPPPSWKVPAPFVALTCLPVQRVTPAIGGWWGPNHSSPTRVTSAGEMRV